MVKIITKPDDVSRYLGDIKKLADLLKKEIGFIPYFAYDESIYKENLFVAIIGEEEKFAGFALCGGRFPVRRIFQLAVSSEYRQRGVGTELVKSVVKHAKKKGFRDIVIKVGKELSANKFWEASSFVVDHTKKGGTVHDKVNIRIREIAPSIFSNKTRLQSDLQLAANRISTTPSLHLIDTNILLDVSTKRENSEVSENLLYLVAQGDIRVAISQETITELKRHRKTNNDRVLKIANQLPQFAFDSDDANHVVDRLKNNIFPNQDTLKQSDDSDIKHLATAIQNNAKGFITRDKQILKQEKLLWGEFSLEVLSPFDFLETDNLSKLDAVDLTSLIGDADIISPKLTADVQKKIKENFN